MPRHADVLCPSREWTLLTDAADATITGVRLQNLSNWPVRIQAKADATSTGLTVGGALILRAGDEIIYSTDTIAALFPGVTSPLHLFALNQSKQPVEISVSHA